MTSDDIRADRDRLANDLLAVQADVALYERLTDAKRKAKLLDAEIAKLDKALVQAVDDERAAALDDLSKRYRNVRVLQRGEKLLNAGSYEILWEAPMWDYQRHETVWAPNQRIGFGAIPDDVMDYILDVKPSVLPAIIANLAPGDPHTAMRRYFRSISANHLVAE